MMVIDSSPFFEIHAMRFVVPLVLILAPGVFAQPKAKPLPVTGEPVSSLAQFDKLILGYLEEHKAPGASLAIAHKGRLVYARGFGYANTETKAPVQPDSLFRTASVSKAITIFAICQLIERGKLSYDTKVLDPVKFKQPAEFDERWRKITIGHLCDHKGGFDRDVLGDPLFMSVDIAKAFKVPAPAKTDHIFKYMLGQSLDFEPGKKYCYSNFGYLLLGRVIEHVGGKPYEKHVQEELLKPLGITDMQIGKTLTTAKNEVRYYDAADPTGYSVFANYLGRKVPTPYGTWCLEAMDASGGWIASAIDLVRIVSALDRENEFPAIKGTSFKYRFWQESNYFGAMHGCSAVVSRLRSGTVVALLFNSRKSNGEKELAQEIHPRLKEMLEKVENWPEGDLFPKYLK